MLKKYKKLNLIKHNNSVYYQMSESLSIFNIDYLNFLKSRVYSTKNKRVRICFHLTEKDRLHEMIILLHKNTYIRPHRHFKKTESLHVIEGEADMIFFNNYGKIISVNKLSRKNGLIYYRINKPIFHTFLVKSKFFIFHETTSGPLKFKKTEYADWSPKESKKILVKMFKGELKNKVDFFKKSLL